MKNEKFKLTDETIKNVYEVNLTRIIALRDFGNIKTGDKGGFVEKEDNLSHENDCWVYDNAEVWGDARATTTVKTFANGFYYVITVTDKHIKIGCEQHPKTEWLNFSKKEIIKMNGAQALKFWEAFKPMAEQLGLFKEI